MKDILLVLRVVWPILPLPLVVYGIRAYYFEHHFKQPTDGTILVWVCIAGILEAWHIRRLAKKNII